MTATVTFDSSKVVSPARRGAPKTATADLDFQPFFHRITPMVRHPFHFGVENSMRALLASISLAAAVTVGTLSTSASVATAAETGMASIHSWRKVGRKTCLIDHQHSGAGSGINRKVAELEAIRSWAGFTDLEYGATWSNYNHAIEKRMSCSGSGSSFQCDLLATPCRPF
jgi:hypothetical protein